MNIEDLRIFITLAEKLNYTQAAEILHISQPTLSRHIMELEEQLGQSLFIRTTRKVELTQFGQRFLAQARRILRDYDSMMRQLAAFSGSSPEHLVIGTPEHMCGSFLPELIRRFASAYPHTSLQLQLIEPGSCINLLRNHVIDVGFFASTDDIFFSEDLEIETVSTGDLVLVVSDSHRLSGARLVQAADLAGERIYLTDRNRTPYLWNAVNRYLEERNLTDCRLEEVSSPEIQMMLVEAGLGVSLLAENLIGEFRSRQLSAVRLAGMERTTALLAARSKNNTGGAPAAFLRMLRACPTQKDDSQRERI